MRTYGTLKRDKGNFQRPAVWGIQCEPQVVLRFKRVFERVSKSQHDWVVLSDTIENCRELSWFVERYPMKISLEDRLYLTAQAEAHRRKLELITQIVSADYKPPVFNLALPPREYQSVAAELVLRNGGLLLADDVGIGKTISAICTFMDPKTLPALVVTLTHLPTQWEREIHRFAPNLRTHIIKTGKVYELSAKPDVVIINYAKLSKWADLLGKICKSVTFDEVQELRTGQGSNKYSAARFIAANANVRLGLSATPIYNFGGEIFNVVDVLCPDALGDHYEFLREWCHGGSADGKARIHDPKAFGLYMREQGLMLRRTRHEVGRELPELTRVPHYVDADPEELKKVEGSAADLARIILAGSHVSSFDKMQASGELDWRLRQATGIAKAPFVAEFVRLLVESGEKVVLYGWHHEVYGIWKEKLRDLGPVLYTGQESVNQKEAAKRAFLEGRSNVLVMSLRAGAGLDGLQGVARTVVFGELDWSPGVHEQCIGRLHRDGQGDKVVAYFLISDEGSDPVVADTLGLKRQQIDAIRDPDIALVESLEQTGDNVRRLALEFLKRRGITVETAA